MAGILVARLCFLAAVLSDAFTLMAHTRPTRTQVVMMGRRAAKNAARKGKSDAIKAKLYARYGKKVVMAVKAGGADTVANAQLAQVVRDAKTAGVPVANIERAIKSASSQDAKDFKESTFEAYGAGGAGIIINVLSDNANRASADVQSTIKKKNLKLASPGSVLFNFERKGRINVDADLEEDQVLEIALEAGAEDFEIFPGDTDGTSMVITLVNDLGLMQNALSDAGLPVVDANLAYMPTLTVECSEEDIEANFAAIEALEDLDDVDSVEHNMQVFVEA